MKSYRFVFLPLAQRCNEVTVNLLKNFGDAWIGVTKKVGAALVPGLGPLTSVVCDDTAIIDVKSAVSTRNRPPYVLCKTYYLFIYTYFCLQPC